MNIIIVTIFSPQVLTESLHRLAVKSQSEDMNNLLPIWKQSALVTQMISSLVWHCWRLLKESAREKGETEGDKGSKCTFTTGMLGTQRQR